MKKTVLVSAMDSPPPTSLSHGLSHGSPRSKSPRGSRIIKKKEERVCKRLSLSNLNQQTITKEEISPLRKASERGEREREREREDWCFGS
mmetsp:Transcript_42622/g.59734  ORF Transcript_42622/g.59734 Transcript_42622/m.59734 type:complete len:90 (+) Transcript_42622:853-1122(+)